MFDKFWNVYPRKVGKRAALKVWEKLSNEEKIDVLAALPNHIQYWKLKNTETEYIPHPSTWLNQGRWEDELDMTPKEIKRPALPWYSTDELTMAKGRELGIQPYAGESMGQYRQRISQQIGKMAA